MSLKKTVNLLPHDQFEFSSVGKLVQWAVSVGRWIVVITEFVVICAFLSRFYFDTKLANLFDEIEQKKAIVASAATFEENFRQTQDKIKIIRGLLNEEIKPSDLISEISQALPLETTLTQISLTEQDLSISGYSLTDRAIKAFLSGLSKNSKLSAVSLTNISSRKDGIPGSDFTIMAVYQEAKTKTK